MTITCRLCGAIINGVLVGNKDIPILGDDHRGSLEYQATVMQFIQHVGQAHPDYVMVLAAMAQNYHIHLVSKMADSSDPAFKEEREKARYLVYWTLAGKFALEDQAPVILTPATPSR